MRTVQHAPPVTGQRLERCVASRSIPLTINCSVQIKDAIRQRHGGTVTDIILYRGALHPDKSLSKFTDGATLLEAGFEGALRPIADDVPVAKIVYEFPSQDRDEFEPILATSGTLCTSKYGLSQKAANAFMAGSKSKCK